MVLLCGSSVDMVLLNLLVVLGVTNGLVFNGFVGVGAVRTLSMAVLEWMGLSMLLFVLTVAVTVMGDAIIMTNSLEFCLRVVVGVSSFLVIGVGVLVDKRSLKSMNINYFVMSLGERLEVSRFVLLGKSMGLNVMSWGNYGFVVLGKGMSLNVMSWGSYGFVVLGKSMGLNVMSWDSYGFVVLGNSMSLDVVSCRSGMVNWDSFVGL